MKQKFLKKLERLIAYFKRHKKYLYWGVLVTVLTNAISMVSPWIVKMAIDDLRQNAATYSQLRTYATLIVILAIGAGFFRFLMRRTIIWGSRIFEYEVRNDFFLHLLGMPRSFYQETRTGDIIARGSNDVEATRLLAGPAVMQIINSTVSISVALTLMFILSWKLTLITLTGFPILSLLTNRLGMKIHEKSYKIQQHFSTMTSYVQENVSGVKVVKSYNQEEDQIKNFAGLNKTYIDLNLSLARIRGLFMPSIYGVVGIIILLLLYFGGKQVINGTITLGTLVAFIFYLMSIMWPMLAVGWVVSLYQRGTASLERIEKIMRRQSEVADSEVDPNAKPERGDIEIKDLTFSYPNDDQEVLKDVDLKIPSGKTVAIVGPTGCGKSTLVELLLRAYKVPDGKIYIDNIDLNKIPQANLRRAVGYVPQETFLFSQTLKENIAFGQEKVVESDVESAAEIAGIKEEISDFPRGFNTILGERGVTLSGGQKQRTALARAIIADPPILILDDAFSAVDTNTEELILRELKNVLKTRTSILISHRISTVKNADMICVMEEGRIEACGTHEELIEKSRLYAHIVELQSLEEELEAIR
jgi:ATP-binding cassette subfamily B protein